MNSLRLSMSCDNNLCSAISSRDIKKIETLIDEKMINIYTCTRHISPIYYALELDQLKIVEYLEKRRANFYSAQITGPFAGFLPIQFISLEGNLTMMEKLDQRREIIIKKRSDVVTAIQLAVLRGHFEIALKLLGMGADIETKVTYCQFKKYASDDKYWNDNFGDQMSLSTYAIFNIQSFKSIAIRKFFERRQNFEITDKNGKTLLMYSIEMLQTYLVTYMLDGCRLWRKNLGVNERDNAGFAAINYLINPVTIKKSNLDVEFDQSDKRIHTLVDVLIRHGADVNITIDNDPKTLPIHIAANCGLSETLKTLLPTQSFYLSLSSPLFYAIQNYIYLSNDDQSFGIAMKSLDDPHVIATVKVIIEGIYLKYLCKYPVNMDEVKLIKKMMKYNATIRDFAKSLTKKIKRIFNELKNVRVKFNNNETSLFEALTASQKVYFSVAKGNFDFYPLDILFDPNHYNDYGIFHKMIRERIKVTKKRLDLIDKWNIVAYSAVTSLLLPFDCIEYIVNLLSNNDLQNFVALFSN